MLGAMAALGIGAAVSNFLGDAISEAREGQKVAALTEQTIRATGGAAKISADGVGRLATAISNKTGMDDEAIQTGANLLLTFKNVRNEVGKGNDVFNQATASAVDLAAAGFGSVDSASKMLGKALNDPVKGMSAMSRAGVTFSASQTEMVKSLVESGDMLGAQKIILGEVQGQVGGAAEASATAGEKASVAFGNLKEELGTALLPAVDAVANAFVKFAPTLSSAIGQIGPLFSSAWGFVKPFVDQVRSFFAGEGGAAVSSFGAQVSGAFAQFLPILQTAAATFRDVVLPAISAVVGYVVAALLPIFQQVWSIISTRVVPIFASLAQFFYGTLYPAIVGIVSAIAQNLRPVFDQLVATFQTSVLPTLDKLLAKFREWQPTIQKVIGVVVKVVGEVLKLSAAILGKVLPVVIRFAGWLISNLIPAISSVIGWIAKIIGVVINLGAAFIDGVQAVAKFVGGLRDKIGQAIEVVKGLPGRAADALGDLARYLADKGRALIQGLIDGIKSKIGDIGGAMKGVADKIKGFLPGSPVKEGPLTSWNNGAAGVRLMDLLAKGIKKGGKKVKETLRGVLDQLKTEMQSLQDSVAGAFTNDLFSGETASEFLKGLTDTKGTLAKLGEAFKTLTGWGLSPEFLSGLFQSGNAGLILDLAANQGAAVQAGSLFSDVQAMSSSLGSSVAQAQFNPQIDKTNAKLDDLIRAVRGVGIDVGDAVGGAAKKGKQKQKKGGKK